MFQLDALSQYDAMSQCVIVNSYQLVQDFFHSKYQLASNFWAFSHFPGIFQAFFHFPTDCSIAMAGAQVLDQRGVHSGDHRGRHRHPGTTEMGDGSPWAHRRYGEMDMDLQGWLYGYSDLWWFMVIIHMDCNPYIIYDYMDMVICLSIFFTWIS